MFRLGTPLQESCWAKEMLEMILEDENTLDAQYQQNQQLLNDRNYRITGLEEENKALKSANSRLKIKVDAYRT